MTSMSTKKSITIKESEPNDTDSYKCGPCNVDDKANPAVGYCQYCRHYLCTQCYNYHKNLGKIHVLLNQESMPRAVPEYDNLSDPCIETCKQHKHKTVELYCKNHDVVCCVICVTLHHKKCDYVYIPDVTASENIDTLRESSETTLKMIQSLIGHFEASVTELADRTNDLDKKKKEFGSTLRKFKKEITECLDDLEKQVVNEARQIHETETKQISENIARCEEAMKALSGSYTRTKAETTADKPNKIFSVTKMSQKHVRDMEECLKSVNKNTFQIDLKFEPNVEITKGLKKVKNYGKVIYKKTVVKVPPEGQDSINPENGVGNKQLGKPDGVKKDRLKTAL